ncbi:MAG: methyltransferase [Flavobacteriaceae bacterium]
MAISSVHQKRYNKTLAFMAQHLKQGSRILDLGTENPFTPQLKAVGYQVQNTQGENLDDAFDLYAQTKVDCVTAFEIFEHLFAPYNILKSLESKKLIASVPLKLWFASAYWNPKDDWDKHYHEFERKQFDLLLEKTGWTIKDKALWTSPDPFKIGIRPLLRYFTPRYYIVYCERD